ncbi:MAG: protein kinase [Acidobacteria bacterium]|nr:protein kinase [Acidobacteriota bacterium]
MADPPDPLFASNWGRFAPGQIVSGRFRIERQLGEGGMGQVYQATDLALHNNAVALKTLHSDLATRPELAQAFRGEVLKAQAVTHINVCRIHQLQEDLSDPDDPLLYFTMELVSGQTLAQLLQQGPLEEALATKILLQVAEGLAAAHRVHVIHCDLKPGNVMVELRGEEDCRAVITDFGLARMKRPQGGEVTESSSEASDKFSGELSGAGTELYQAPEQVLDQRASPSSDVYAFGLIAYQVLTGQLPHAELRKVGQFISRDREAPPPPSSLRPLLSPHWDELVTRCLQPDPDDRWDMAQIASAIAHPHRPWYALPRLTRRQLIGSTIFLAIVSLMAAIYRFWNQGKANAAPGTLILMTPVEGLQDPPIEPVLRTALEPSPRLRLWEASRLTAVLADMKRPYSGALDAPTWRQVARREHAQFLTFTNLASLADGFTVNVRVEQPGNSLFRPDKRWEKAFSASTRTELLETANRAGLWIRDQLGESASSISATNPPTQDVATSSWEAWKEFQRGEDLGRTHESHLEEEAAVAYDAALRHDPQFSLAAFRKGDLLVHVGKNQEGFAAYARGAQLAAARPASPWWDLLYQFELASDTGDWLLAERIGRERCQKFPGHSGVHFYAAWPLLHLGRTEEARTMFERSRQLAGTAAVHARLALVEFTLGKRREAEELLTVVHQMGHREWSTQWAVAGAYILNDHRRALDLLPSARAADQQARSQSDLDIREAIVLADSGRSVAGLEKLIQSFSRDSAPELRDRKAVKLMAAGWLAWDLGQTQSAVRWARESLELESGMPNRLHGGALLARCGENGRAQQLLNEWPLPELHNYRLGKLRLEAEVALAAGNRASARRAVAAAQRLDASAYGSPHDAWVLDHLGEPGAREAHFAILKQKSFQLQVVWPEPAGHWRRALGRAWELSKPGDASVAELNQLLHHTTI